MSTALGVADHWGWAILVTVDGDGTLLDRRRVVLVDETLPAYPHHHDAQGLPVDEAVALVERVVRSVEEHASRCLDVLATEIPTIATIALRECPPLPASVAERLTDYRAQNVADSVMYRGVLARAAGARGWTVHWYDARRVLDKHTADIVAKAGAAVRRPWTKDHRVAMAAAIAAAALITS